MTEDSVQPSADPPTDYVTTSAWVGGAGRPDHIDEVADQFERRAYRPGVIVESGAPAWPRRSRGWRLRDPLGHRTHDPLERRVG